MKTENKLKDIVKEKYGKIAFAAKSTGCCNSSTSCCNNSSSVEFIMIGDEYKNLNGYVPDADLGLGCGLPTEVAGIKEGDIVLDLGCGAGNDVFIARSVVGEKGKVIGIDMTAEMIEKAKNNNSLTNFDNVEFRLGEIESLPVDDNSIDVVISNCVLNLVPDKEKAFKEILRVLKPGAHFCISDTVLNGELPEEFKKSAELYTGCISGALKKDDYLNIIFKTGFNNVEIVKSKEINLPEEILQKHLSSDELKQFKKNSVGIFSITIKGKK